MKLDTLLFKIIEMTPGEKLNIYPDIQIEFRGYEGLVARKAWDQPWKFRKHKDRPKIGLFDFRVILNDKPPNHTKILRSTMENIKKENLEEIYEGKPPETISCEDEGTLHQIQLMFLEQEINYGEEEFQAWTRFKAPRDFFMAYLLKVLDMPSDAGLRKIKEWTDRYGIIRKPPIEKEWSPYVQNGEKWLRGEILYKYQKVASDSPVNPRFPFPD